ncbi:MAG: hypothetical protein KGK02_10170 [Rhodospirillales bacterium]|nr:hypothetical protein [Rhodospirillales bacterium]
MSAPNPWDEYFANLGAPLREEVKAFESLGQNCEFAFVQHGNEFGEGNLLSWALVEGGIPALVKLLNQNFAGLFTRDALEPLLGGALVKDRQYQIAFHSHLVVRQENGATLPTPTPEQDAIYAEEASKHAYLTGKMRRQLTEGGRIWVYRSPTAVKWSESAALHAALNRFGRNQLLVVQTHPQRNGQAEPLDQGLFHGYLAQAAPPDKAWFFDPVGWGTLLRATLRLAR